MSGSINHHLFVSLNVFGYPNVLESHQAPTFSSLSESMEASLMWFRVQDFESLRLELNPGFAAS